MRRDSGKRWTAAKGTMMIDQLMTLVSEAQAMIESVTADTTLTLLILVVAFLSACVIFPMSVLITADSKEEKARKAELAKLVPANLMIGEQA